MLKNDKKKSQNSPEKIDVFRKTTAPKINKNTADKKNISNNPSPKKTINKQKTKRSDSNKISTPHRIKNKEIINHQPAIHIFERFYEKLPFFKRLSAKKVLSLDIDPDSIRYLVGLKSGGHLQILNWGMQKFPADEKDRKKAMQIAVENIHSKVYKHGMEVDVGIFSPEINIRQVTLPKMKKDSDLSNALHFKNQSDLQNYDDNSIWAYDILNEFEKEGTSYYNILLTTAPFKVINGYIQIFENLKIVIKNIYPRPAAIEAAYRKMVFRPGRDMLINVAYNLTQMVFLKNGELEFIRNVSIGSRNLEVTIHEPESEKGSKKKISEKTVSLSSTDNPAILRNKLLSKINDLKNKQNPVLHTFFSEILRSLSFIQGRNLNNYIERIFITGYGVRKESLIPYLRSRLNMPVFVLAPQLKKNKGRTLETAAFFTTLGNALQERKSFNLLDKKYQTRKLLKKINVILIFVIVMLALFLGYISMQQTRIITQKKSLIEQYNLEYKQLNPIEGLFKNLKQQIKEVNEKNSELHDYVKVRPPVIKVLQFFSNETPANIRLEKVKFSKLTLDKSDKKHKKEDVFENSYKYQIDLSGIIRTEPLMGDVTLINYINKLIDKNFFKRVELLNKLKDPEKKITKFDVRMYL